MNSDYLTIPQIADETKIPASTVRRYLEQHNHALRTKKGNRGAWLLQKEDVPLMLEIRSCYEHNMSAKEVEDFLLQSGQPITITVDDDQDHVMTPANAFMQLAGEVQQLQSEITATREQLAAAHEEITVLKKQQTTDSEQQQESISALTTQVASIHDGIGRLEREQEKRKKNSFWGRLLGR